MRGRPNAVVAANAVHGAVAANSVHAAVAANAMKVGRLAGGGSRLVDARRAPLPLVAQPANGVLDPGVAEDERQVREQTRDRRLGRRLKG